MPLYTAKKTVSSPPAIGPRRDVPPAGAEGWTPVPAVRGRYAAFEKPAFQPAGSTEVWSIGFSDAVLEEWDIGGNPPLHIRAADVEFAGVVSEPTSDGRAGWKVRQFVVTEIRRVKGPWPARRRRRSLRRLVTRTAQRFASRRRSPSREPAAAPDLPSFPTNAFCPLSVSYRDGAGLRRCEACGRLTYGAAQRGDQAAT